MLKTIFLEALEDFKNIDLPQALYSDDPIACGVPVKEDICPLKDALGHAARIFKYSEEMIIGKGRHRFLVQARYALIFVISQKKVYNNSEIARFMKRDHSIVQYAVDRAKQLYNTDFSYKKKVDDLKRFVL